MKQALNGEEGIALFLVLWVLTLLSVIVGEFCYTMRTEINVTRNFKEGTESYYISVAGLNRTIAELLKSAYSPKKPGGSFIPPVPFGGGEYRVEVENESGKVNINLASRNMLMMILNSFDLEEQDKSTIVDSILDWRDKDNLHRLNGAEDDYYLSLPEPYECKDGDFDTIEELLLVKGVSPEIFDSGLNRMVTIYSKVKKININAASEKMLVSLPGMSDTLAYEIINYRRENEIKGKSELIDIIGPDIYTSISPYITLKTSPYYTIKSFGTLKESEVMQGVKAVVRIDPAIKKGYRLIRWVDSVEDEFVF